MPRVLTIASKKAENKSPRPLCPLFLSRSRLVSRILRTLLTLADQSRLASGVPEFPVCTSFHCLWHLALLDEFDVAVGVDDGERKSNALEVLGLLRARNILLAGIVLLMLTDLAGEEDQAGSVLL